MDSKLWWSVALVLTISVQIVYSENILFLLPTSSKSHRNVFDPLAKGLAEKGHQVTVVSSFLPTKPIHANVKELAPAEIWQKSVEVMGNPLKLREMGIWGMMRMNMDFIWDGCHDLYKNPEFMALLQGNFSLAYIDMLMNDCLYGFLHKMEVPFVIVSTLPAPNNILQHVGLRLPSSFVPSPFIDVSGRMTFPQRLLNLFFNLFTEVLWELNYVHEAEPIYRKYLGEDMPPMWDIVANASMFFMNSHFTLTYPRPNMPDTLEIGGLHCGPAKPLPKDLEDFVNGGKDGFIFFSLGSIVQGHHMPDSKRQIFLNVFSRLKQRVVWKWESGSMPDVPPNVKLVKWAPQQSLLAHPNIRLFMTHGGLLSTQEATYHAVPIIGIPIFGDQDLNVGKAKRAGYGLDVEILTMTEESLAETINTIINNKSYSEKVKELSTLFRDQSESPLERAIYWSEYILRHKGAKHLRSAAREFNFFQYHSLDTSAALFLIIILILWILKTILMFFVRKICRLVGWRNDRNKKNK